MKKVIAIAVAGVVGLAGLMFFNQANDNRTVLKVANWAEYIDGGDANSPLIREFEQWYKQQTGKDIRVEYCIADDNETLYNMIKMGSAASGSSSAIAKAENPAAVAEEMIAAVKRAYDEMK